MQAALCCAIHQKASGPGQGAPNSSGADTWRQPSPRRGGRWAATCLLLQGALGGVQAVPTGHGAAASRRNARSGMARQQLLGQLAAPGPHSHRDATLALGGVNGEGMRVDGGLQGPPERRAARGR